MNNEKKVDDQSVSLSISGPGLDRLERLGLELQGLVFFNPELKVVAIQWRNSACEAEIMKQLELQTAAVIN